jgi:hypothetical protein
MLSDADKKQYLKKGLEAFRNSGSDEVDIGRVAVLTALESGRAVTALCPEDAYEEEDEEARPVDWRERYLGFALDSLVFGELPVDDSGKLLAGAEVRSEVMTAGGTPLGVTVEDGCLCLTDPFGAKARVRGVVGRSPKFIQCVTDRSLMEEEWLGAGRVASEGTVERLTRSPRKPLSLSAALGHWQEFEGRSKKDGSRFRIRSRAGYAPLREFALQNKLFRVSCTLPGDAVDGDGLPISMSELNRFEDELLMRLVTMKPKTVPIAAVSQRGVHDLYYSAEHNGALFAALKAAGERPFAVRTTHMVGDVPMLLDSFMPVEKRLKEASAKDLVRGLMTGFLRVSPKPKSGEKRTD